METLQKEGKCIYIGISNVNLAQLELLYERATVKPKFVQNRCYAQLGWDIKVREFCKQKGIIYQGFSLLTANTFVLPHLQHISDKLQRTPAQVLFKFAQQIDILPLTGTANQEHMQEDLALNFDLTNEDIEFIKKIAL